MFRFEYIRNTIAKLQNDDEIMDPPFKYNAKTNLGGVEQPFF